jgi:hypothetical protein
VEVARIESEVGGVTREEILEMKPGRELDALVSEIMEPKPVNTLTYRQLEEIDRLKPNGGTYGCWSIESPEGWWEINIDWAEACRSGYIEEIPEYCPSKEPSEEISASWEVVEKMREMTWQYSIKSVGKLNLAVFVKTIVDEEGSKDRIANKISPTVPEAICKAALLAVISDATT